MDTETAQSRWSLNHTGNRVLWAVIAALLTWIAVQSAVPSLLVGVVLFVVLTALVSRRDR